MLRGPGSKRAAVFLFSLCVLAASAIAGAAVYRYMIWGGDLPNGFAASLVDYNADGAPEYLVTRARVDLPESGDYSVNAVLLGGPNEEIVAQTTGRVEMDRGPNVFGAGFWGPDIRKSEVSGPYTVRLTFVREQSDSILDRPASPDMVGRVYQWEFTTAAYDYASFQDQPSPVTITGPVTSLRTDWDSDGLYDGYSLDIPVSVRTNNLYSVRAESDQLFLTGVTDRFLGVPQGSLITGPSFVQMFPGQQDVQIFVPTEQVYFSGIDEELAVHVTISDTRQVPGDVHPCCGTGPTVTSDDPAFAPPPDGYELGLRQPYVLPPTPISFKEEAHFTEVVHWYDFEAPWMPIEFTGVVRDFGTDADADGMFDQLTIEAEVNVRSTGAYDFSGTLYVAGSEPTGEPLTRSTPSADAVVTTAWNRVWFNDWTQLDRTQVVRLEFAGAELLAAGRDGPFDAKLRIVPANVYIDPVVVHTTAAYSLADFEATGAKVARVGDISITPTSPGAFEVVAGSDAGDTGFTIIARIIHDNGVVASDVQMRGGGSLVLYFQTDLARASDFTVAVYLIGPNGEGVDYLEVPLATD